MRIGVDVGGTHTDAVVLRDAEVVATHKVLTSTDVVGGVRGALEQLLNEGEVEPLKIEQVMIGTTQFTNAVIERRQLTPTAAIRIALPSGDGLPPMLDWPDDIAEVVGRHAFMLDGGSLYDGRELAALDDTQIDRLIRDLDQNQLRSVAIAAAFAPMNSAPERYVADRICRALPDVQVTLSHQFGRLGLIERENAAILNASLRPFAEQVVQAFVDAAQQMGLNCPIYISQNDGTLMSTQFVREFPALTFASGPTNSLRGARWLTQLEDAIVVDIGGTTSDVGVLHKGFPRESNTVVDVGGIRTNFRMPDILPLGLGGGSLVTEDGAHIGPRSVGHRLVTDGLVFGGDTLTATDIVVAAGTASIGDESLVADLETGVVKRAKQTMQDMLRHAVESMKPSDQSLPVVLVGGGAVLVDPAFDLGAQVLRPQHADVANAIGAAIAQVGGEAEQMVSYREVPRETAIEQVTAAAKQRAQQAGANRASIRTVDMEETAVPYMDEGATRVRVKVVGDIASAEGPTL